MASSEGVSTRNWSRGAQDQGRMRSSSSALCALSSLVPPSPILEASSLSVTWSSGEIPILIQSGSISSMTLSEGSDETEVSAGVASSSSVDTMGTFGPTRDIVGLQSAPGVYQSTAIDDAVDPGQPMMNQFLPYARNIPGQSENLSPTPRQRFRSASFARASAYLVSRENEDVDIISDTGSHNCSRFPSSISNGYIMDAIPNIDTHEYKEEDCTGDQILNYMLPSQTFSTLPTPNFASPSPSPSVDLVLSCPVTPRSKQRKQWSRLRGELRRNTSTPRHINDLVHSITTTLCAALPGFSSPEPANNAYAVGTARAQTPSKHGQSVLDQKHDFLPESLSWLKHFVIGLLIDQEGFRAIQPSFKLIGYSSHSRSWNDHIHIPAEGYAEEDGVVEFMPSKRESFNFHYTPFDSLPTLRRIMVNGNESRDYISRQASLSLKSNGVYAVRGTETTSSPANANGSIPGPSHGSEPPKLKWKFEYMVDDRRVDSTGQIMDGEKTLTPLTFSCSPMLLHSQQGKKVGLMHVVLKSVIPNLTAEKMEPPNLSLRSGNSMSNLKATIQNTTSHYFVKSHAWTRHRRTRSNALQPEDQVALIKPSPTRNPNVQIFPKSPGDYSKHQTRRRRASSAGERTRHVPMTAIENVIPVRPRNIMPPAKLSDMLSTNLGGIALAVSPRKRTSDVPGQQRYHYH